MSDNVAAQAPAPLYAQRRINVKGRIFDAGDELVGVGPGAIASMVEYGQAGPQKLVPGVPAPRRERRRKPEPDPQPPADSAVGDDEVPLDQLKLSPAAAKALAKLEIATVEQLEARIEEHGDVEALDGIGEKLADEITQALETFYAG